MSREDRRKQAAADLAAFQRAAADLAASGADQPTLRDQLVLALYEHRRANARKIPGVSSDDDMPLLLRVLRAESERFADALLPVMERAKAEAAAEALEKAADWLNADPDKGGAPYIAGDDSVLFPHRLDIAEVVTWAAASLRDRAAALRSNAGGDGG